MSVQHSAVKVRRARLVDAPTIVDFQVRMARETEGMSLAPDVVDRGVRAVFADSTKGRYWVAEADGSIVGVLLTTREWSDWRNGYVLWLQSVYVVPEVRRRGVFRALYERVRMEVEASPELLGIRLYADKRNPSAHAAYEAMGMSRDHYDTYEWMKRG